MRSEHPETIRTLVANGFGYAIVNACPRTGTALDGGRVVAVPLRGELRPMRLGLASLRRDPRDSHRDTPSSSTAATRSRRPACPACCSPRSDADRTHTATSTHPLDPLSPDELERAVVALRRDGGLAERGRG